jgi:hypothetical protein
MDKIVVAAWLQLMAEFILSGEPAQNALFLFCLGFILHKDSIFIGSDWSSITGKVLE